MIEDRNEVLALRQECKKLQLESQLKKHLSQIPNCEYILVTRLKNKRRELDRELEKLRTHEIGRVLWHAFKQSKKEERKEGKRLKKFVEAKKGVHLVISFPCRFCFFQLNKDPQERIEETSSEVFDGARERRLERIVNAYRLAGRTIFEHQEDLAVRLDIAYKGRCGIKRQFFIRSSSLIWIPFLGKYCETKYIFLRRSSKDHHLYIWKHTIPSFIPLKDLETRFLQSNLTVSYRKS
jgi:hypothetical protein